MRNFKTLLPRRRRRVDVGLAAMLALIASGLSLIGVSLAAWLTHVVVCIKTANYLFLLVGALAAPVGVVHGIGVWFGAW